MFNKVKKYSIIFIISILFSVFIFSIINLFIEEPKYENYCNQTYYDKINDSYNNSEIILCNENYEKDIKNYKQYCFIISTIISLITIILTLYIKIKKGIIEWFFSGFMIGGIISIFITTLQYFNYMNRLFKPIIMLFEIGLIIWITIKTSNKKTFI